MKNPRELIEGVVWGAAAVGLATFFHYFFPGMGAILKPLYWPLAVLAFRVRLRYSAPVCALVPFLSWALTGMPHLGIAALLALTLPLGAAAIALLRQLLARRGICAAAKF